MKFHIKSKKVALCNTSRFAKTHLVTIDEWQDIADENKCLKCKRSYEKSNPVETKQQVEVSVNRVESASVFSKSLDEYLKEKIGVNDYVKCIKCDADMPKLRLTKYGFKKCVNCSNVEKLGGIPITNHKTGNTIQIVPKSVADNAIKLSARQGYGVSNGMKYSL